MRMIHNQKIIDEVNLKLEDILKKAERLFGNNQGGDKMTNKETAVTQIVGTLVTYNLNAKETIEALEKAKDIFLERSWHTASEGYVPKSN